MRADGSGVVQLTNSLGLDGLPAFSPDGTKIVFVSDRAQKDSRKLYVMGANGGTATRLINQSGSTFQMVPDWQPLQAKDPCTIRGTINVDNLVGTPGPDVICGLGGDDTIDGLGGNDRIDGGAGSDNLYGDAGQDTLIGGNGNDCFYAQDGTRDVVNGGPGKDDALVDPTKDTLVSMEKSFSKWPKKNRPCP